LEFFILPIIILESGDQDKPVEALLFRRTAAAYSGNGCPGRFG